MEFCHLVTSHPTSSDNPAIMIAHLFDNIQPHCLWLFHVFSLHYIFLHYAPFLLFNLLLLLLVSSFCSSFLSFYFLFSSSHSFSSSSPPRPSFFFLFFFFYYLFFSLLLGLLLLFSFSTFYFLSLHSLYWQT